MTHAQGSLSRPMQVQAALPWRCTMHVPAAASVVCAVPACCCLTSLSVSLITRKVEARCLKMAARLSRGHFLSSSQPCHTWPAAREAVSSQRHDAQTGQT